MLKNGYPVRNVVHRSAQEHYVKNVNNLWNQAKKRKEIGIPPQKEDPKRIVMR
mgnify:CR=1 FL=1